MSASNQNGLFGKGVNPQERAAHIACAVVLTIVVLAVIISLIVYFTTGMDSTGCIGATDASDVTLNDNRKIATDMRKIVKQQPKTPVRTSADVQSTSQFRQPTTVSQLLNSQNPQGVSRLPQRQDYDDQLKQYNHDFKTAMTNNPLVGQLVDQPILHASYQHSANRGDLPDAYTDNVLFSKNMNKWRQQGTLRHGQSEAYLQAMGNLDGQHHVAPIRPVQ